jgi:hypothetical protein
MGLLPVLCNIPDRAEEGWIGHALLVSGEVDDLDDGLFEFHGVQNV